MSNCRKFILREAYKLFLSNNMEKVTISELEKATGRLRGTIFYHFRDKQNLFESVIEEIFIPLIEVPPNAMNMAESLPFNLFVKQFESIEERAFSQTRKMFSISDIENCYYNFLSQACKYYPQIRNKYSDIVNRELSVWKIAIGKAQNNNIVPNRDLTEMAYIFMLLKTGILFNEGHIHTSVHNFNSYELIVKMGESFSSILQEDKK